MVCGLMGSGGTLLTGCQPPDEPSTAAQAPPVDTHLALTLAELHLVEARAVQSGWPPASTSRLRDSVLRERGMTDTQLVARLREGMRSSEQAAAVYTVIDSLLDAEARRLRE